MSDIDSEILKEFVDESKGLMISLVELLESIEGDFSKVQLLADYGNQVDRVMGGAKALALMSNTEQAVHIIGDYAALCKAVGYKASQIKGNEEFFNICVALLLDATETLNLLIDRIEAPAKELKQAIGEDILERLAWVSGQFGENVSGSVSVTKDPAGTVNQNELDDLLKKLGV